MLISAVIAGLQKKCKKYQDLFSSFTLYYLYKIRWCYLPALFQTKEPLQKGFIQQEGNRMKKLFQLVRHQNLSIFDISLDMYIVFYILSYKCCFNHPLISTSHLINMIYSWLIAEQLHKKVSYLFMRWVVIKTITAK